MINNQRNEGNNKEATTDKNRISPPSISLPKGGGAIRGIDEKFSANPVMGTGSLSVPIFTTPSRSDFYPKLSLSYDSGSGNSPFGLGWELSIPSITRKTDKGLPRYWDREDSDTFILSGAEDLVPTLIKQNDGTWERDSFEKPADEEPYIGEAYTVQRYRPRIEGLFARIEKWTHKETGDVHWESITKDNVKSIYGKSTEDTKGKISDPDDDSRVFKWLLEETYDDKGNVIVYEYKQENADNVDHSLPQEKNRLANGASFANRYLKRIKYGNKTPFQRDEWLFQVVFDYGEHDPDKPEVGEVSKWLPRPDAFSSYKATFEIRAYRLCRRVLMFHNFPELGDTPCLVRSTDFRYNESDPDQSPVACYLMSVTQTGYIRDEQTKNYQKKSLPPLEVTYTERTINEEIRFADSESLANLPVGLDGAQYQWVDLDGEGISGILTEQADAWFYKRNLGNAEFGSVQVIPSPPPPPLSNPGNIRFTPVQLVSSKPSVANLQGGGQQLMDLAGDGQLDLVQFSDPLPGYYERNNENGWEPFIAFDSSPNIAWNDPNLRFIDLNGDGHADILISENEVFVWYPSLAEEGFGPAEVVRKPYDEEKGPVLVFADSTQSIFLADMSGDGLTDIARIRNGEVCYWPNMGYGRFGAKVTMDAAPIFDHPEYFNQSRIRLADIDGSGTTDIIYLGRDTITIWFNQAGNSWSKPHHLSNFPPTDNLSSVTVIDLLGIGIACIVWSSPLPSANGHPMQYIDLMGGIKPHLLKTTKNNMGAETRVQYASSTKYYLEDLVAGTPWITRLPFPVHTVERVETYDYVGKTKLVTLSKYHHGYYDSEEREFRGFGLVEQWDTEYFSNFKGEGLFNGDIANADEGFHQPPVYTKTWFHTGAFLDRDNISQHYVEEYYSGDPQAALLPDTILPPGLTAREEQEACRALKGSMLRQEVYAQDDSPKSKHPYAVTETAYKLRLIQPGRDGQHAVFYAYQCEALSYHYERNPEDPRIGHAMTLEVDDFGNVLKEVAIGYGRRQPDMNLSPEDRVKQTRTLVTYTENRLTNATQATDAYRAPLPCETRTYELTGYEPGGAASRFAASDFTQLTDVGLVHRFDSEIAYEQTPTTGKQRRLIEHLRTVYRLDDLGADQNDPLALLPLGQAEVLALPGETYKFAFTPGLLDKVFVLPGKVTSPDLKGVLEEGRYVDSASLKTGGLFPTTDDDGWWWIPSGQVFYSPNEDNTAAQELDHARQHFFLPHRFLDPFGATTTVRYDAYDLLLLETEDALHNKVTVGERDHEGKITPRNDYRTLQAKLVTDPNGNRAEVVFDVVGLVVGTAVMGKIDEDKGDSLAEFNADFDETTMRRHIEDPLADPHAILQGATTRLVYDLFAYHRTQNDPHPQPTVVYTLAREIHRSDLAPGEQTKVQHSFSYFDGFGREVQKKIQAELGPLVEGGPNVNPRWVGSGWTIFNNKGKPVRWFDPFFSATHAFEFNQMVGISPIFFYDPVGRIVVTLHPDHTWEKVVFDPWRQETWDVNDTVSITDPKTDPDVGSFFRRLSDAEYLPTWHAQRISGGLGTQEQDAANKAAAHANTPAVSHFDTLGRTFLTIADNGATGKYATRVNLDIEGNQREVTDAKGRLVMCYDYDMLGSPIQQASMEAGNRWTLNNAVGNAMRAWDNRGHTFRTEYDQLRRPVRAFVRGADPQDPDKEILFKRMEYGEGRPNDVELNLRTRVVLQFDGAGRLENEEYDFKGNLLRSSRKLVSNYSTIPDWSADPAVEQETFTSSTTYDALNRPVTLIAPDNSVIRLRLNEANLLNGVEVNLRGDASVTTFVQNIDYNVMGQRERILYGNNTMTRYDYDPVTFRLTRLLTTRNNGTEVLQDLYYAYDPVGNITSIHDDAQQTIYFNGSVIEPHAGYTYDAIYRLIEATGREHIGQVSEPQITWDNKFRVNLPHPNNGQAMRPYTEEYSYDEVGNTREVGHTAPNGGWTRTYAYNEPSLNAPGEMNNRLSSSTVGSITESYAYDAHGNMTTMPHLSQMGWDFGDQLQMVDLGGGGKAYYVYDAGGQRIRKVWEKSPGLTEERIYVGGFEVFRRRNGSGAVTLERETLHIMDDKRRIVLVETRTQGSDSSPTQLVRYQYGNHFGSASLELDGIGQIISYEEYYPYGSTSYQAVRSQTEVPRKRYRYTGKERDEETELYYHGARYYACWLGRWTSCDPVGIQDGVNAYEYVVSNPISYVDPNGEETALEGDGERPLRVRSLPNGGFVVKEAPDYIANPTEENFLNYELSGDQKYLERALEHAEKVNMSRAQVEYFAKYAGVKLSERPMSWFELFMFAYNPGGGGSGKSGSGKSGSGKSGSDKQGGQQQPSLKSASKAAKETQIKGDIGSSKSGPGKVGTGGSPTTVTNPGGYNVIDPEKGELSARNCIVCSAAALKNQMYGKRPDGRPWTVKDLDPRDVISSQDISRAGHALNAVKRITGISYDAKPVDLKVAKVDQIKSGHYIIIARTASGGHMVYMQKTESGKIIIHDAQKSTIHTLEEFNRQYSSVAAYRFYNEKPNAK